VSWFLVEHSLQKHAVSMLLWKRGAERREWK